MALAGLSIMLCLQLPAEAGESGPDIQVSQTDSPDPVSPGATITYTIVATNNGPGAPEKIEITADVPAGTSFVSASGGSPFVPDPSPGDNGLVVHLFYGPIEPGDSVTMTMVVMVNPGSADGTIITNTASARHIADLGDDPDLSNNEVSIETTVVYQSDIRASKDGVSPVSPGTNLTYTVTAVNNGPDTPKTMRIEDVMPCSPNITFVSASGGVPTSPDPDVDTDCGTVIHEFLGVAAGDFVALTVVVAINASTPVGSFYTSTAVVSSSSPDPTPGNNNAIMYTFVNLRSDISTTKLESDDPVSPGANLTYTITATNNGPDKPDTITIRDEMPPNTTFVSATGGVPTNGDPLVGSCCDDITRVFPGVSPGGSVVLTVVVAINPLMQNGGIITNIAVSFPNSYDWVSGNDRASIETTVLRGRFHTMAPCRVLDTRSTPIGGGAFEHGQVRPYGFSACPIPPEARAVSLNVTVADPSGSGEFNLFSADIDDDDAPGTVIVSFRAGINRATNAVVGVSEALQMKAEASLPSGGRVDLIVDINGYFD